MSSPWSRVARAEAGDDYAAAYADRFRRLADEGQDVHGEAALVASLVAPPARVLDAGCGTGRVAVRLAELGYDVVGVDADAAMVAVAREEAPDLTWEVTDLAELVSDKEPFDLVLLAGNVVPLLTTGSLPTVAHRLAALTAVGGLLVAGFGLDAEHLPAGCGVTPLADYERALYDAGWVPMGRWSTWDRAPVADDPGYVVALHRRTA